MNLLRPVHAVINSRPFAPYHWDGSASRAQESGLPTCRRLAGQYKFRLVLFSLLVLCKESHCYSGFAIAVEVNLCESGAGIPVVLSKETPVVFFQVRE